MRIHHIGYLIKFIDRARALFEKLGFDAVGDVVYDERRDVDILFMRNGECVVELVSPKSERSVVARLMGRYKNMPYHICYVSDDLERDVELLSGAGFMQIDAPAPAPALESRRVCFMINAQIGIIELVENSTNFQSGGGLFQTADSAAYRLALILYLYIRKAHGMEGML